MAGTKIKTDIYLCLLITFSVAFGDNCMIGKYNLTALHTFSPWYTINDNTNATFQISLCSKLTLNNTQGAHNCPDGTSVCAVYPNGTAISFGGYSPDLHWQESSNDYAGSNGDLTVMLSGERCQSASNEPFSTFFHFKCGKTLGHPIWLGDLYCSVHIEWESYVFCQKLPVPEKEVPCAVVKNGQLIDLSPLTKLSGGYLVDEDENEQSDRRIYINVCRDITPAKDDGTLTCPKGSGSCKVFGNNTADFGQPNRRLEVTSSGVRLVYTSTEKPGSCLDVPSTTINFVCPQRGGSKEPVLVTGFLVACTMEIEWVTEYACPADYITSKTCQLTKEQHGITIDLSPLKHPKYASYTLNVTDGSDHYQYRINVCDALSSACGDTSSVCQTKLGDEGFHRSAGESAHMKLRYSDGRLTMTLKNGDKCSSDYRRDSMIEFFCNKSAIDDGNGYPEFVEHSNCSYFFKWGTKYACSDHLLDDTCRVNVDGKRFDLAALVREQGSNWEVITGAENDDETILINVCHDVLNSGEASQCPAGTAVCKKDSSGAVSLGRYVKSLEFDKESNSLRLHYTDGQDMQKTTGCKAHTMVRFYCAPGNVNSAPRLVHKSQDNCFYEIEWHTSAACVLSRATGDNCRVYDDAAGFVFDLNPLTLTDGSYNVSGSDGYSYLINVCTRLHDASFCASPPHDNAAICQVKNDLSSDQRKVAEPTTQLEYFDGVLNLTYTNGEAYNNPDHTRRMAEIAFLCDVSAGKGQPEFLEERNFTYSFLWRTSYACPTQPMECVVKDAATNTQYDLSSLSRSSENWYTESTDDLSNRKKFYINVCRPVRPVPGVACSAFASVCATSFSNGKEVLFHGNLGRAESAPVLETSIHGIKLVYTSGNTCQDNDGNMKNFKTIIHFTCMPGKVAEGPMSPQLVTPCEYSILWETEAACPVKTVDSTGTKCTVSDPSSNFIFNLMPLYKPEGYEVKTSNKSYRINICGALPESVCGKFDNNGPTTVCEIGPKVNTSQATLNTGLKYSSQGQIILNYTGHSNQNLGGSYNMFVFNFFCDRTAQSPVITFDSQSVLSMVFRVNTTLACAPQPVSCKTQDSLGRQFDLTPLARETGNWIVIDNRPTHKDLSYHINVCRPVNPTPEVSCPGGAVGSCQTGGSGNYSMGYVQSEPVASSDGGTVTILYKGGDLCHKGTENESFRSTRILFNCDTVEHDPVFQSESDTCEYTFVWKTPSACPQKVTVGSNCKVVDPLYNFEFDLSSLRHTSDNYNVTANGYQFLLNVCGPLVNAPGPCGEGGVSACQTGANLQSPVKIGNSNDQPIYNSGQISLVYSEGKGSCHGTFTRSTIINFMCDHTKTGPTLPQYVDEKSDCTYVFEWHTSVVCPPHQITDCTFRHGDDVFDFHQLTRSDGNYEREYPDEKKIFIVNVCRSLVHKKDQTCPFDAAACMIDLSESDAKKKFHNIGEVTSQSISYQNGVIILRYDNGELCSDGKTKRSTVILFKCDSNSDALGSPFGHFTVNDCEDHFLWTSSAACPLKKEEDKPNTGTDFGDCRVTNPNTGYMFDLSSLKKDKGYRVSDREGHEFMLNVCGWLDNSSTCKNGTGSCIIAQAGDNRGTNAGNANANLFYRSGLILEYHGGEYCGRHRIPRATNINFICAPEAGNGVPVYVDKSDDCLYYFEWQTQLACEKEVTCEVTTDTGDTLDLSPLIKTTGKYNVMMNYGNLPPGMIYINLCRPLNPIYGTLCPAGSGACLVRDGQKPLSLGRVDTGPVWDSTSKQIKLTYLHGDPCPSNSNVNMTSVILLKCGTDEQSEPQLENVASDCEYLFLWETPLACAETSQPLGADCTYYDHNERTKYDLSSLAEQVDVKSSHGGTFQVKLCSHLEDKGEKGSTSCSQSSVCLSGGESRDGSYGNSTSGMFRKASGFLSLKFSQGRNCQTGSEKAVSTIYFHCDSSAGKGVPRILEEEKDCVVSFRWDTSLLCPVEKKPCHIISNGKMYDFTVLSQNTGNWNFMDGAGNVYWLNLCQALHGPAIKAGCPENASVCRKTSAGQVQMLGQLSTQMVTSADNPKPTIIFQYTDGNADACNLGRRRRSDHIPKVTIKMTCGSTIGSPVFVQQSSECVFEFQWTTRFACEDTLTNINVKEHNGLVTDDRTKLTINLRPLLALNTSKETVADTNYLLRLGGPVQLDPSLPQAAQCKDAAACQVSLDSKSYKNLGSFSSKTYYIRNEHLEVVFTSSEKCDKDPQHNVRTTITFTCRQGETVARPYFLHETPDCGYIFNWDTSLVCLDAQLSIIQPDGDLNSQESSSYKVVAGVSVIATIVVACLLVLVFHKAERRAVIGYKLKRIILCRRSHETPILYSKLTDSDQEDTAIDHDPFNPFSEPDEETEIINHSHLPVRMSRRYHDDSDEDMLL